ncbi:hypothetical protein M758_UG271100 [Ceratodon purpureus]|nr:hypothetical protein M758_UG271100 [Ceratodon purpureus]
MANMSRALASTAGCVLISPTLGAGCVLISPTIDAPPSLSRFRELGVESQKLRSVAFSLALFFPRFLISLESCTDTTRQPQSSFATWRL